MQAAPVTSQLNADGSVTLVVPLHITLSLGGAGVTLSSVASAVKPADDSVEKVAMPWHDTSYGDRKGYSESFLDPGLKVPLPKPADDTVIALTKDGAKLLHYQNFSIAMHRHRRLALFTASNVTAESKLKRPEPNRQYSRDALAGLGKNDIEQWFTDPRLADEFQLPDVFFTKDRQAFDKGHIVRRDDVAWGKTYDLLRRANGDTYHTTNCSPQVAGFNRSNLGTDNWGALENHVLKGASSERYCQFAGPVFADHDRVFEGTSGGGVRLDVKIPSRFWKVIVARTTDGLVSYGFVLEQDLSAVRFEEFVVPGTFAKFMEPLAELQKLAGIVFDPAVLAADQFATNEGVEVAFRAGARRRSNGVIDSFARPA